ncbi:MAG: alpha/beta hydrolase [Eubacterium sp.]|nr:alpha/beta hydrolase [Eubacterium sp.]
MDDNEYTALDALKTNKIPLLIINGTSDRIAPPFMAEQLYSSCKAPKVKMTIDNAGHMKSYYKDTEKYQAVVLKFFNTSLK